MNVMKMFSWLISNRASLFVIFFYSTNVICVCLACNHGACMAEQRTIILDVPFYGKHSILSRLFLFTVLCVAGVAYFAFLSPSLYLHLLLLASFFRVALVRLKRSFCFIMCKSLGQTLCKRAYEIALALHNGSSFWVRSHEPSEYDSVCRLRHCIRCRCRCRCPQINVY